MISFYDFYLGRALEIKYPKNPHRRRVIDLLAKWEEYKQGLAGEADRIIGFDLVDTSPVVKERAKAALLFCPPGTWSGSTRPGA